MEVPINKNEAPPSSESAPKIPPGPLLSVGAFFGARKKRPNILSNVQVIYLTSGRMAISMALQLGNIGENDEVLVPAYHCSSMVAPIVHNQGTPIFYKIKPDMSVDFDDLEKNISDHTRALLATHYFGFPQDLPALRKFCDAHRILLIEDCAHSFFGRVAGFPIGSYGDFSIGSLMKFFPIFDGGSLASKQHDLSRISLKSGGKGFEIQSLINTLEKSFAYGRLPLLKWMLILPLALKSYIWNRIKQNKKNSGQSFKSAPVASGGGFDFDSEWTNTRISYISKLIVRIVSKPHIALKRRRHYALMAAQLSGSDEYYPLHPELDENTVPYAFPLIVKKPDPGFYTLRSSGVPLMRWEYLWEGVDGDTCKNSQYYSRHLIQIPCHQALKTKEVEWIIRKIKETFDSSVSYTSA